MKTRNTVLDLWKFIAAIIISLLHYNYRIVPHGYLSVEFFFLIAGYMIYANREKYRATTMLENIMSKLQSVYFWWIILSFMGFIYHLIRGDLHWNAGTWGVRIVKTLLFIPYIFETPATSPDSFWLPWGQLWYIPVWFGVSVLAIGIVKVIPGENYIKYAIAIISICVTAIVYNATPNHMLNMSQEQLIGPFSFGVVRGIQDILLGMTLGILCEEAFRYTAKIKITKAGQFFLTSIEFFALSCLAVIYFTRSITPELDYIYIVFVSIIIILSELNVDYINKSLKKLGGGLRHIVSLSPAIYFMHFTVRLLLEKNGIADNKISHIIIYLVSVFIGSVAGAFAEKHLRNFSSFLWNKLFAVDG